MGAETAVELATVSNCWERVVGPQVAAHAWPQSLRQGALVVATDHPAWATELRFLSAQLIDRLRVEGVEIGSLTVTVSHRERPGW